jgi:protein KIBRA
VYFGPEDFEVAGEEEEEDHSHCEACIEYSDKETNTECTFMPCCRPRTTAEALVASAHRAAIVKRSKTFSPSAPLSKHEYICRLNRSDSDSSMPLYRHDVPGGGGAVGGGVPALPSANASPLGVPGSFQRNSLVRKSMRFKFAGSTVPGSSLSIPVPTPASMIPPLPGGSAPAGRQKTQVTSLDLALDRAAQFTKLKILQDEIRRLRELKDRLEGAAAAAGGSKAVVNLALPQWFMNNDELHAQIEVKTDVFSERCLCFFFLQNELLSPGLRTSWDQFAVTLLLFALLLLDFSLMKNLSKLGKNDHILDILNPR